MKHTLFTQQPCLYLVTDNHCLKNGINLEKAVEQAILGGVNIVQFREKTANSRQLFEQALRLQQICQSYQIPFIINDRLDIALAVGADGVHLGQSDLPADVARRILGDKKIIGVSARTVAEAQLAKQQGADYLGVGAMFGTATKDDAKVIDLTTVQAIFTNCDLPMILIGGIGQNNLELLQKNLVDWQVKPAGFAMVSAILAQDDIFQASQNLSKMMSNVKSY